MFESLKSALSSLLEAFREFAASILYQFRRLRADGKQREALPSSYREYRKYKTTYGIAPGDAVTIEDNPTVILSITGAPTISAKVEYYDLKEDMVYKTGLANIFRQVG